MGGTAVLDAEICRERQNIQNSAKRPIEVRLVSKEGSQQDDIE